MNILFLTLLSFDSLQERTLYTDLLREFVKNNHNVYAISPVEKRQKTGTHIIRENNATILRLKTGNTQKTNIIEKGISTVMIEPIIKNAVKHYFSDVKFDLVLYSTPPITFVSAIEYVKKRDNAKTYLLLKDIFPQNAVDIGLIRKTGIKGLLYQHFRNQEKKLYKISDRIGCMSQANVDYVINHNPEIKSSIVEVCPNCVDVIEKSVDETMRNSIREKYGIPLHKKVFVYGGNLGKPQGIHFLIDCLKTVKDREDIYFLIVGDGTEYKHLQDFVESEKPDNIRVMKRLPKDDYDTMVGSCDVGLIFLDHRFTIPNFPSRLLAYMQANIPVLAVTDPNTDVGKLIVEGDFGWWCESNSVTDFCSTINTIISTNCKYNSQNERKILQDMFSSEVAYKTIIKLIDKNENLND